MRLLVTCLLVSERRSCRPFLLAKVCPPYMFLISDARRLNVVKRSSYRIHSGFYKAKLEVRDSKLYTKVSLFY